MTGSSGPLTVWVLQTGEPLPFGELELRPMRAMNVTNALISAGHNVVLWGGDFSHQDRHHRFGKHTRIRVSEQLEVRLVHSRGYQRNVGFGRLVDHAQFGWELRRLLKNEQPPDVAFVGFPPIECAAVMTSWLAKHGVPSLLDVKDCWPDVLLRAVPTSARPLGRTALAPYYHLARRCMNDATGISSITDDFLQWSLDFAQRDQKAADGVFALTSPRPHVERLELEAAEAWWDEHNVLDDGRMRASFVGSLGTALDLDPIMKAATETDCQFVICGSGSRERHFREMASGIPNIVMPGWVSHFQSEVLSQRSTTSLVPYVQTDDFLMSIPNKVYDALANGLPILTSLSGRLERFINTENVGKRYSGENGRTLTDRINDLTTDRVTLAEMSTRATGLYDTEYSFEIVYGRLVTHLEKMAAATHPG